MKTILDNLLAGKYNKTVVAVVGIVLTVLNIVFTKNQAVQMIISIATAAGVYQVPNNVGVKK